MLKQKMTIGRVAGILDRVVSMQLHMTQAAHGEVVAGQVLAKLLSIVVSNNVLFVNTREAMEVLWEKVTESSSAALPIIEFLNATTMTFYMRFHGEDVMPEELISFGTSCLAPAGDKAVFEEEFANDLPTEKVVDLYRDNRWFVVLALMTMSSAIQNIKDTTVPRRDEDR